MTPAPAATTAAPLRANVELHATGRGTLRMGGKVRPIVAPDIDTARHNIIDLVTQRAQEHGAPVTLHAVDPDGDFAVTIDTDGTVTEAVNAPAPQPDDDNSHRSPVHLVAPPPPTQPRTTSRPTPMSASTPPTPTAAWHQLAQTPHPDEHAPKPAPTPAPVVPTSMSTSLLPASNDEQERTLSPAEVKAQAQQASLLDATSNEAPARDGVRGGACKTPTTILLAAIFARYGGAGVVAWDNNSTRGTLGWRTQQGPHEATIEDLLPVVEDLVGRDALAASMARYTHYQRLDRYDVLRSRPEALSKSQPTDANAVNSVHRVLTKYYRMLFIDSGNDESAEQWQAMIRKADAIVVPTTTRPEHAESARLLLAELAGADTHCANLASNALVVVSQASRAEAAPNEYVETFSQMTRAAVGIPYDPAMTASPLLLDSLAPATRRAWLAAGAALTGAFTTN